MQRRSLLAVAGIAAGLALAACGSPQATTPSTAPPSASETPDATITEYPVDRIRFIVPWAAGSGPDAPARVIAEQLQEDLGVKVLVENIEGGRSLNGLYQISTSKPDGSTIGWASDGQAMNPHLAPDAAFRGPEMLTHIGRVKVVTNGILANPERGWSTVEDIVAAAKAAPGQITAAVPQANSSQAIQFALFAESAGVEFKTVAFGSGENVLPAVNGTADLTVSQLSAVVQFAEAGQLTWIATLGGAPEGFEVPSVHDAGFDTQGYLSSEGVVAPPGMSPELTQFLSDAVERAVNSKRFQDFAASSHTTVSFAPHDEYAKQMAEAFERAPKLIEKFGLEG